MFSCFYFFKRMLFWVFLKTQEVQADQTLAIGRIGNPLFPWIIPARPATLFGRNWTSREKMTHFSQGQHDGGFRVRVRWISVAATFAAERRYQDEVPSLMAIFNQPPRATYPPIRNKGFNEALLRETNG